MKGKMKEVAFTWDSDRNSDPFSEGAVLQCQMLRTDKKQVKITCANHSKKTLQNLRFRTNLPAEAYSTVLPTRVLPGRTAQILVNLDGDVLWDDKVDGGVTFEFAYDLIKDTSR